MISPSPPSRGRKVTPGGREKRESTLSEKEKHRFQQHKVIGEQKEKFCGEQKCLFMAIIIFMKIGLLYNTTDRPWGGINTFFRNFKREAEACRNIELVSDFSEADIILTSGHYSGPGKLLSKSALRNYSLGRHPLNPLGFFPKKGKAKIVFRLDGLRIFYRKVHSRADDLLLNNLKVADSVVFQSEHCREIFDSMQVYRPALDTTILNGANSANFYPAKFAEPEDLPEKIVITANSWSRDASKGFANIVEFAKLENVEVQHIGRWSETIPSGDVKLLGEKQEKAIGEILRTSHFLLFPSENDACPNIVMEALASGIPVLYHNSGGTPELCGHGKYGIQLPENPAEFSQLIEKAKKQYCELRRNILKNIEEFTFTRCFNEYIEFFQKIK
jgi:glycosyltransferase involved in cell wall biosynthesis